jgi:uncharacterized protein (DUF1778 family)
MQMKTARFKENEITNDRITARIPQSTRLIIERAAAIYGATINQFIVQAAAERATEVLNRMESITLSSRDTRIFLNALTTPSQPNENLMDAVCAHSRLVDSHD